MATYDPRTGKKLGAGTTQDFSNYKGSFNFDANTGKRLSNVISTDQLQSAQPYNLNLPTPRVPSSGLESAITGSVTTYKTQSEQERAMREAAQTDTRAGLDRSINEIMGLQTEIGNVGNTVDRTMEDTARKEADRYTSEIEAEQLAVRRKIEALQKNPQGMTAGAIADESNRFERESLSKQADLAILQNSALRNYTTAKDIADREVQNKLEPLKIKLENLKFFYQENKELFNKEDERLYNEKIKSEEREYEKQENLQQTIADVKVELAKTGNSSLIRRVSMIDTTKPGALDEVLKIASEGYVNELVSGAGYDLSSKQQTILNGIINKYSADNIVQQGQTAQQVYNLTNTLMQNPDNPGNQLISLYTLVKNLDPDSAVREGEVDLAQMTNSFLGKYEDKLARISKGRVINPRAVKELSTAAQTLADEWVKSAQRRQVQYVSQANVFGLQEPFNIYLGGFDGLGQNEPATTVNADDPLGIFR